MNIKKIYSPLIRGLKCYPNDWTKLIGWHIKSRTKPIPVLKLSWHTSATIYILDHDNRHILERERENKKSLHSMILPWNMVLQMQFGQPIPSMGVRVVSRQSQLEILLCCLISNPKKKTRRQKPNSIFNILHHFRYQTFLKKKKMPTLRRGIRRLSLRSQ